MGKLISIGIILLFIAILLIFIGSIKSSKTETAFGGFILGIPFGFASSKQMFYILLIFLAIIFIINIILRYLR